MTKKQAAALIASVLGIVVGIILVFVGHGNAAIAATNNTPAHAVLSLNGHWKQTKSGIPGVVMDATIENDTIQVNITMPSNESSRSDVSGLYWTGTFNTGGDNLSPFSVTSVGDTGAMDEAMFGSQDSSKVFYYNNGVLSFPFSMMGVSTTVELSRS